MLVFEPNLYMDRVYCTASATTPQDTAMLSLLGEEEAKNSMGGKTVEENMFINIFMLTGKFSQIKTAIGHFVYN